MKNGAVIHFEVPADDEERARKFYSKVFGWQFNVMPEMNYALVSTTDVDKNGMVTTPGTVNGGMAKRGNHVKAPVITINVDSIDQTLQTIEKHGGKILQKRMDLPGGMGSTGYFVDSEGNTIGLWQMPKA
jgi:uncharacterized protein